MAAVTYFVVAESNGRKFQPLPKQVSLLLRLWRSVVKSIEDVVLQQLLVRHPDFDGLAGRAVLAVPALHERNVDGATGSSGSEIQQEQDQYYSNLPLGVEFLAGDNGKHVSLPGVEGSRGPEERDTVGRVVGVKRAL